MIRHTPGPWAILSRKHGIFTVGREGAKTFVTAIDTLDSDPLQRRIADARLIAAAPDLLAAAMLVLRGVEGGSIVLRAPCVNVDPNAENLDLRSVADVLRDVITRATGEMP